MLKKKDICVAIAEMFNPTDPLHYHRVQTGSIPRSWFEPQVIIFFGDTSVLQQLTVLLDAYSENPESLFRKV